MWGERKGRKKKKELKDGVCVELTHIQELAPNLGKDCRTWRRLLLPRDLALAVPLTCPPPVDEYRVSTIAGDPLWKYWWTLVLLGRDAGGTMAEEIGSAARYEGKRGLLLQLLLWWPQTASMVLLL